MRSSNSCQSFHTVVIFKKSQVQLTHSAQLDIDPLMNACTLLILFWQSYKYGSKRERERKKKCSKIFSDISNLLCMGCF